MKLYKQLGLPAKSTASTAISTVYTRDSGPSSSLSLPRTRCSIDASIPVASMHRWIQQQSGKIPPLARSVRQAIEQQQQGRRRVSPAALLLSPLFFVRWHHDRNSRHLETPHSDDDAIHAVPGLAAVRTPIRLDGLGCKEQASLQSRVGRARCAAARAVASTPGCRHRRCPDGLRTPAGAVRPGRTETAAVGAPIVHCVCDGQNHLFPCTVSLAPRPHESYADLAGCMKHRKSRTRTQRQHLQTSHTHTRIPGVIVISRPAQPRSISDVREHLRVNWSVFQRPSTPSL